MVEIYSYGSNSVTLEYTLSIARDSGGTSATVTATGTLIGNGSGKDSNNDLYIHLKQNVTPANTDSTSTYVTNYGSDLGTFNSITIEGVTRDNNLFKTHPLNGTTVPTSGIPFEATWKITELSAGTEYNYNNCSIFLSASATDPSYTNGNSAYKFIGKKNGSINNRLRYVTENFTLPVTTGIVINSISYIQKTYGTDEEGVAKSYNYALNLTSANYTLTNIEESALQMQFYESDQTTTIGSPIFLNKNLVLGNVLKWSTDKYYLRLLANVSGNTYYSNIAEIEYYNNTCDNSLPTKDSTESGLTLYDSLTIGGTFDTGATYSCIGYIEGSDSNTYLQNITVSEDQVYIPLQDSTFFGQEDITLELTISNGEKNSVTKTFSKKYKYYTNPFIGQTVEYTAPATIKPFSEGEIEVSKITAKLDGESLGIGLLYNNNFISIDKNAEETKYDFENASYNLLGVTDKNKNYTMYIVGTKTVTDELEISHIIYDLTGKSVTIQFLDEIYNITISHTPTGSIVESGAYVFAIKLYSYNTYNNATIKLEYKFSSEEDSSWKTIGAQTVDFSSGENTFSFDALTMPEIKEDTINVQYYCSYGVFSKTGTVNFSSTKFIPVTANLHDPAYVAEGTTLTLKADLTNMNGANYATLCAYAASSTWTGAAASSAGLITCQITTQSKSLDKIDVYVTSTTDSSSSSLIKTLSLGSLIDVKMGEIATIAPRKNAVGINIAPTSDTSTNTYEHFVVSDMYSSSKLLTVAAAYTTNTSTSEQEASGIITLNGDVYVTLDGGTWNS